MGEGTRGTAGPERSGAGGSTQAPSGRLRVFISYSRDDIDFADQLEAGLTVTGFDVAMDRHGITAGEDFQRRLGALIREADTVVFVLSPSSARSQMCAWEVEEAMRLGKRIIPVVCCGLESNEPPPHLKSLDYVFFYAEPKVAGSGFGHGLARLVAALNTDLDWMREHTRLLARATEWETAGRVENRMLSGADIAAAKEWASKRPKGAPEPTALHLDYIRASEDVEHARTNAERKRLTEMAAAQAEREEALKKAEIAQQEKTYATQRLVQRTMIGMVVAIVLALAAGAAGVIAWRNQQVAEGQRLRAERNLDAITQALGVLDKEASPKAIAETFFKLAHTYLSQDRFDEAITLYKRSLAIVDKQEGAKSEQAAALYSQLGLVYAKVGKLPEAEFHLKQALSYYAQLPDISRTDQLTTLAQLTNVYKSEGKAAEAVEAEKQTRSIAIANAASIVPVYFATDRAFFSSGGRDTFMSDRGRSLQLGRALVTIPKSHELSNIERPWRLSIGYLNVSIYEQAEDPRQHFTIQELTRMTEPQLAESVRKRLDSSSEFKDRALVYVPGFNSSFDNSVYRTAQLAYNLKFDGPAFVYSWPSGGEVFSYTYDRESAQAARPYLRAFLKFVAEKSGAKNISILANGLGSLPVLDVLTDIANSNPSRKLIDQLILTAPDVDGDSFREIAASLSGIANGITLYVAADDRALEVSRKFWGHYRAGDVPPNGPVVVDGVDTIDVTAASAGARSNPGTVSPDTLLSDVGALIESGTRPPDKRSDRFVPVESSAGRYWRYRPQ
jgi:esterase/lipase superfamily enzyme